MKIDRLIGIPHR